MATCGRKSFSSMSSRFMMSSLIFCLLTLSITLMPVLNVAETGLWSLGLGEVRVPYLIM